MAAPTQVQALAQPLPLLPCPFNCINGPKYLSSIRTLAHAMGFDPHHVQAARCLFGCLLECTPGLTTRVGKVPCLLVQLLQATINLPVIIWPECGFPSSIWLVHSPLYMVRWIGLLLMTPKTCDNYR